MVAKAKRQRQQINRWTRSSDKEQYWRAQVRLWRASGLSVRAFCHEHGVVEPSFYAWRRELLIRDREHIGSNEIQNSDAAPDTVKDRKGRTIPAHFREKLQPAPNSTATNPFVKLSIVEDSQTGTGKRELAVPGLTVTTPHGYQISLATAADVELLGQVVRILEEGKC
jgi:transposase-like protein